MRDLGEVVDQTLTWRQRTGLPTWSYELWAGEDLVATVHRDQALTSEAMGETARGRWLFERTDVDQHVTARELRGDGSYLHVAVIKPNLRGAGDLTLRGAPRAYHWGATNLLRTGWAWHDSTGVPVLAVTSPLAILDIHGEVTLAANAVPILDLELLVTLGWYLRLVTAAPR